jgi:putative membrane protein
MKLKTRWLGIYLRGLAMGAADVVPGVSGGTVAFITGIYEELLASIKAVNPAAVRLLFSAGPAAAWRHINGNFLLLLGLGILTSIFSLAKLISQLLEQQPLLVWSFFFGLILASSIHMARQLKCWNVQTLVALGAGIAIALVIALLKPAQLPPTPLLVFLAGAIAICAMILPGISGSFILLLLGMYSHILAAVKQLDLLLLVFFAAGCGVGLLSFANLLSWLFRRFHELTLSLLTGFLVGSLYLVWPWKHTLSSYLNSRGELMALTRKNVLPGDFLALTGGDPQTLYCLLFVACGLLAVLFLEFFGAKSAKSA